MRTLPDPDALLAFSSTVLTGKHELAKEAMLMLKSSETLLRLAWLWPAIAIVQTTSKHKRQNLPVASIDIFELVEASAPQMFPRPKCFQGFFARARSNQGVPRDLSQLPTYLPTCLPTYLHT